MGRLAPDAVLALAAASAAGFVLGVFYFGTLWLTIGVLERSSRPGLLLLVSMFGRLAVTLVLFYRVAGGRADRLLACLAGLIVARLVLVSRVRPRAGGRRAAEDDGGVRPAPDA